MATRKRHKRGANQGTCVLPNWYASHLPRGSFAHACSADILAFIAFLVLLPSIFSRGTRIYPIPIFTAFVWLAFICSLVAFCFMIGIFVSARDRFRTLGIDSDLGAMVSNNLTRGLHRGLIRTHPGLGFPCGDCLSWSPRDSFGVHAPCARLS